MSLSTLLNPPQINHLVGGLSAKEKQMVASSWLLNRDILGKVTSKLSVTTGQLLKLALKDGKVANYLVTWLSSPEACFAAQRVHISFRAPKRAGDCLAYAVIKLPEENK